MKKLLGLIIFSFCFEQFVFSADDLNNLKKDFSFRKQLESEYKSLKPSELVDLFHKKIETSHSEITFIDQSIFGMASALQQIDAKLVSLQYQQSFSLYPEDMGTVEEFYKHGSFQDHLILKSRKSAAEKLRKACAALENYEKMSKEKQLERVALDKITIQSFYSPYGFHYQEVLSLGTPESIKKYWQYEIAYQQGSLLDIENNLRVMKDQRVQSYFYDTFQNMHVERTALLENIDRNITERHRLKSSYDQYEKIHGQIYQSYQRELGAENNSKQTLIEPIHENHLVQLTSSSVQDFVTVRQWQKMAQSLKRFNYDREHKQSIKDIKDIVLFAHDYQKQLEQKKKKKNVIGATQLLSNKISEANINRAISGFANISYKAKKTLKEEQDAQALLLKKQALLLKQKEYAQYQKGLALQLQKKEKEEQYQKEKVKKEEDQFLNQLLSDVKKVSTHEIATPSVDDIIQNVVGTATLTNKMIGDVFEQAELLLKSNKISCDFLIKELKNKQIQNDAMKSGTAFMMSGAEECFKEYSRFVGLKDVSHELASYCKDQFNILENILYTNDRSLRWMISFIPSWHESYVRQLKNLEKQVSSYDSSEIKVKISKIEPLIEGLETQFKEHLKAGNKDLAKAILSRKIALVKTLTEIKEIDQKMFVIGVMQELHGPGGILHVQDGYRCYDELNYQKYNKSISETDKKIDTIIDESICNGFLTNQTVRDVLKKTELLIKDGKVTYQTVFEKTKEAHDFNDKNMSALLLKQVGSKMYFKKYYDLITLQIPYDCDNAESLDRVFTSLDNSLKSKNRSLRWLISFDPVSNTNHLKILEQLRNETAGCDKNKIVDDMKLLNDLTRQLEKQINPETKRVAAKKFIEDNYTQLDLLKVQYQKMLVVEFMEKLHAPGGLLHIPEGYNLSDEVDYRRFEEKC